MLLLDQRSNIHLTPTLTMPNWEVQRRMDEDVREYADFYAALAGNVDEDNCPDENE
jgi:hypothetical protein